MRFRSQRIAALLMVAGLFAGCSRSESSVEGTVTYDGEPVTIGSIAFLPSDSKGIKRGARIENGHFVTEPKFPLSPGPHRVEIHWLKPTGKKYKNEFGEEFDRTSEGLPDKYHKDSTLLREIEPGKNVVDFNLEK